MIDKSLRQIQEENEEEKVAPPPPPNKLFAQQDATATRFSSSPSPPGTNTNPGYVEGVSEEIYNNVPPFNYEGHLGEVSRVLFNVATGKKTKERIRPFQTNKKREDAWRMYLGLDQEDSTFNPSRHKPTRSSDQGGDSTYYEFADHEDFVNMLPGAGNWSVGSLVDRISKGEGNRIVLTGRDGVMGNYTLSLGEDEEGSYISYYDNWDLSVVPKGLPVGRPFEIYGRVYYEPETYRPINPETGNTYASGL